METPQTRLYRLFKNEPTEHAPAWLLFPYHPYLSYVDVYQLPSYQPVIELIPTHAITLNRRNVHVRLHAPDVQYNHYRETIPNGISYHYFQIQYQSIQLQSVTQYDQNGNVIRRKKLLETNEELEQFCSLPLNLNPFHIEQELNQWRIRYEQEKKEFPPEMGAMMLSVGEPIQDIQPWCALESFAEWSLTHTELIEAYLRQAQKRHLLIYEYCLKNQLAPFFFMVGSELAAPPMVSVKTFWNWIVPFAQELIDLIHRYQKLVIQHFHGQIRLLLEGFRTMNPDALHTIEEPPIGNCTIEEARSVLGSKMVLIGNIQYDEFRSLSEEEMKKRVQNLWDRVKGTPFILSPSAGPFDPNPPNQVIRNYVIFLKTAYQLS